MTHKNVKKITLWGVLSWIFGWTFGVLFVLTGLGVFASSEFVPGLTILIMGAVLLPPMNKIFKEKMNLELSKGIKITIIIIGFIIVGMTADTDSTNNQIKRQTSEAINENSNSGSSNLITKFSEEMLPLPSELPTEYKIGKKEDITKEHRRITSKNAQEGFDSGKQLSISKYKASTFRNSFFQR